MSGILPPEVLSSTLQVNIMYGNTVPKGYWRNLNW